MIRADSISRLVARIRPRRWLAMRSIAAIVALLLAALLPVQGAAQGPPDEAAPTHRGPVPPGPTQPEQESLNALKLELDQIEAALRRDRLSEPQFDERRHRAIQIREQALQITQDMKPRAHILRERLQALQPASEGAQESEAIVAERESVEQMLARAEGLIKQAQDIDLRVRTIIATIAEKRQRRFRDQVFLHYRSVLSPQFWTVSLAQIPFALRSLGILIGDWWSKLRAGGDNGMIGLLIGVLFAAVLIASPLQRFVLRRSYRDIDQSRPEYYEKLTKAIWIVFVNTIFPFAGVFLVILVVDANEVLPRWVQGMLGNLIAGVVIFSFIQGLARAVLAPTRPRWRLFEISRAFVGRLFWSIVCMGGVIALNEIFVSIATVVSAPYTLFALISAGVSFAMIGLAVFLLRTAARVFTPADNADADTDAGGAAATYTPWRLLVPLGWLFVLAALAALILGYINLGWLLMAAPVVIGAILTAFYLLQRFIDLVFSRNMTASARFGRRFMRSSGISEFRMRQLSVFVSGLLRLLLFVFMLNFIPNLFGMAISDFVGSPNALLSGISIGNLTISFPTILFAIGLFVFLIIVVRQLRHWLDNRMLPNTNLDIGLRSSISTAFSWSGMVLAALVTFSYLGLSLSNITIVAGALSLGIGFGLQSIVNNFVSGLILLAERPIKAGDWIVAGTDEGFVRRINVRATELQTFDSATVIVPNSNLISGTVVNWTLRDKVGRIIIPVGVSYSADPEDVRTLLLQCARDHEHVMPYPEPVVFFMNFGASSLDFELRCYLADIERGVRVKSDLRFAIHKALAQAKIEIPFPQTDINIKGLDKLEMRPRHHADPD